MTPLKRKAIYPTNSPLPTRSSEGGGRSRSRPGRGGTRCGTRGATRDPREDSVDLPALMAGGLDAEAAEVARWRSKLLCEWRMLAKHRCFLRSKEPRVKRNVAWTNQDVGFTGLDPLE